MTLLYAGNLVGWVRFEQVSVSQASLVAALFNLAQDSGLPAIGYFSNNTGRINMAAFMSFLAGLLALIVWIFANLYGVLIFYALIGGSVAGTSWSTIAPVSVEVVRLRDVPSELNIIWLAIVLLCTFSEPTALEIVGATEQCLSTQLFIGLAYVAAAGCMLVLSGWKIGELEETVTTKREAGTANPAVDPEQVMENREAVGMRSRIEGRRRMLIDCWKWVKV